MSDSRNNKRKKVKPKKDLGNDRKKTIKGIFSLIVIFTFILGIYFYPNINNQIKINKYQGKTIGHLISYEENNYIKQGFDGSKEYVLNYEIKYSFNVDSIAYYKSIYLNPQKINLYKLSKLKSGEKELIVKYNLQNPNENTIIIE